jgi:hypothetical protein
VSYLIASIRPSSFYSGLWRAWTVVQVSPLFIKP